MARVPTLISAKHRIFLYKISVQDKWVSLLINNIWYTKYVARLNKVPINVLPLHKKDVEHAWVCQEQ